MIRFSSSMIYRLFWWFSSSQAANYGGFLKWIPKYQNARMPTIPCLTTDRHQLPRRCCIFPRRRELHHFEVNPNNMGRFQSYLRLPDNSQANFWSPCWRSENMIIIEQQFPMTWNEYEWIISILYPYCLMGYIPISPQPHRCHRCQGAGRLSTKPSWASSQASWKSSCDPLRNGWLFWKWGFHHQP